jgi:hypothetical protein
MSNKHEDMRDHHNIAFEAGKKAHSAVKTAFLFSCNKDLKCLRFWAEDYDAICLALKAHGYRHDGFRIGHLKAIRFDERKG